MRETGKHAGGGRETTMQFHGALCTYSRVKGHPRREATFHSSPTQENAITVTIIIRAPTPNFLGSRRSLDVVRRNSELT